MWRFYDLIDALEHQKINGGTIRYDLSEGVTRFGKHG